MNRLSENNCLKGCMVYLVVLVVIVVGGAFGLGGLSAGLDAGEQNSEVTGQASEGDTRINIQLSPQEQQGQAVPAPTSTPVPAQIESQPQQPTAQPQPQPPPTAQNNTANPEPETRNPELDISGQATSPFYIVQPDDTLFEIALRFGYSVEALRAANNLGPDDNLIYSGNVLYLPGSEPSGGPQSQLPAPAPVEQGEPPLQPTGGGSATTEQPVPTMPRTGVNAEP